MTGLVVVVVGMLAVAQLGMRFGISHDPVELHVDPIEVVAPDKNNFDLLVPPYSPEFDASASELEDAVAIVMSSLARTDQVASSESPPLSTWVTTSAVWAFPDYTSIRIIPVDDEISTIAIFARSRFGLNDLGVNADRNEAIVAALQAELESR